MKELFLHKTETFIKTTYKTDSVIFKEVLFEEPNRKLITLCYYWDPHEECDYFELVFGLRNYDNNQIECESIGRFPQEQPTFEDISKVLIRLFDFR